jgi:two-component system chemotaxis sensor kinase CheA
VSIPEELVKQFRVVAAQRLARIEASWSLLVRQLDEESAMVVHRELHTLKGESKMIGFADINTVCHKLEGLLEAARARGYSVDEDFDAIVQMAIRLMAMLARKKVGAHLGGIDLPGFLGQIDSLLAEIRPEHRARTTGAMQPLRASTSAPRVSVALRARIEPAAVNAFIEYVSAKKLRRDRLRASWHALRDLVGMHRALVGPAQLLKHRTNAMELAKELGKQIDASFEIGTAEGTAQILSAVDSALLHLVRNALDHGLGTPEERLASGKPAHGSLRVRTYANDNELVVHVEDDGRGVSLDAVRARASELGLVEANADIRDLWVDLVCAPGFTTRTRASEISGRGAGLDAVRRGVAEVGGSLAGVTRDGHGTTWTLTIPLPKITVDVQVVRAPGVSFPLVLAPEWSRVPTAQNTPVYDLAYHLGISDTRANGEARYFTNGDRTVGFILDGEPIAANARRLVTQPPPGAYEVVVVETMEGLLVYPDRLK